MTGSFGKAVMTVGALAALGLGGSALADAASNGSSPRTTAAAQQGAQQGPQPRGRERGPERPAGPAAVGRHREHGPCRHARRGT
jgi:hypothetical protein